MKEKRKEEIKEMVNEVGHNDDFELKTGTIDTALTVNMTPVKPKTAEEIINTLRIDIPKCEIIPVNGRIFVVEITGSETKTASGIILPHKMAIKKNDQVQDLCRYFVVTWDKDGIPPEVSDKLSVGLEVVPFLPPEAQEWTLPKVIDWNTAREFKVLHYTELAGVSAIMPVEVEKKK